MKSNADDIFVHLLLTSKGEGPTLAWGRDGNEDGRNGKQVKGSICLIGGNLFPAMVYEMSFI